MTCARALYAYVRSAAAPVTREAAAEAVGISRKLAAFHLDKLVEAGLLEAGTRTAQRAPRRPGAQGVPPGPRADRGLRATARSRSARRGVAGRARQPRPDRNQAPQRPRGSPRSAAGRAGSPNATGSGRAGWAPSGPSRSRPGCSRSRVSSRSGAVRPYGCATARSTRWPPSTPRSSAASTARSCTGCSPGCRPSTPSRQSSSRAPGRAAWSCGRADLRMRWRNTVLMRHNGLSTPRDDGPLGKASPSSHGRCAMSSVRTEGNRAVPTTRGVVYLHSCTPAIAPHVEWALAGVLGQPGAAPVGRTAGRADAAARRGLLGRPGRHRRRAGQGS